MSQEKSGIQTQNDEPADQVPHIRASIGEKILLSIGAGSTGFGITLLHRHLQDPRFGHRLQEYLTSLPIRIPSHFQTPALSCEYLLCTFIVLVPIYCFCIVRLFAEREWRASHLPRVLFMALPTLLMGALLTRDLNTVFLEIFPGILNIGIIGALAVDIITAPKSGGEIDGQM